MKRIALILVAALLAITGCATVQELGATVGTSVSNVVAPKTPEAQIKFGADAGAAVTATTSALLKNDRITVAQAEGYLIMVKGARDTLGKMEATLTRCRASTGSTPQTSPDPCKPAVADLLALSLNSIASVKRALDAK